MVNYDELVAKNDLVTSEEWSEIRRRMLDHIVNIANSEINPLIIQGMLKVISDTDKWKDEYDREKLKSDNT